MLQKQQQELYEHQQKLQEQRLQQERMEKEKLEQIKHKNKDEESKFIFFFLWSAHHSMLATCLCLEYCRAWFSELSSRISESTTGYTFTPCVGSFTSPGIDTS